MEIVRNFTIFVTESANLPENNSSHHNKEIDYDRFVADVWVCVALTLMVLSCIGLLCSCMLYHKLQQWKSHDRVRSANGNNRDDDQDSLPSYTLVTGLPTYEQAITQIKEANNKLTFTVECEVVKNEKTLNSNDGAFVSQQVACCSTTTQTDEVQKEKC